MTEANSKENGMTRPSYDQFVRFFYYEKERFEWMNGLFNEQIKGLMNEWMNEWRNKWMNEWTTELE